MQFNSKVDVMRSVTERDSVGGVSGTSATIHKNLPCRINWSRGREKVIFGKQDYLRDAKLYCRIVDITEKDTIIHNGIEFNIVGLVNVDNRNRQMVLDIIKLA